MRLVFDGDCRDGFDPTAVRHAIAQELGLDERRAARLFSGKRVVLKRSLDAAGVEQWTARFAALGAVVHAEPAKAHAGTAPGRRYRLSPRARRRRRVRLAVTLGLCVLGLIVVAVALGPGMNALLAPSARPIAAAPASSAPAAAPPSPSPAVTAAPPAPAPSIAVARVPASAAAPPAAADSEYPSEMTPEAVRDFRQRYLAARPFRAFALSPLGAWGWAGGAVGDNEARDDALSRCMRARRDPEDSCRIVHAGNAWEE